VDELGRQGRTAQDDRDGNAFLVKGFQVVFHESGGFHQQTAHGDAVGIVFAIGLNDIFHRLFDAQIHHLVAVVGQDDVHQVFANVVNIALDGGDHEGALTGTIAVFLFHKGFQVGDSSFHGLGRLQHKGQLHLARTKQFPHHLHAVEQKGVDDVERFVLLQGIRQGVFQADAFTIDDVLLQPFFDGQVFGDRLFFLQALALEQRRELGEGIVGDDIAVKFTAVVDQVSTNLLVSGSILARGRILAALTIAPSKPTCMASWRNTELRSPAPPD
jgi:hypothetical protein